MAPIRKNTTPQVYPLHFLEAFREESRRRQRCFIPAERLEARNHILDLSFAVVEVSVFPVTDVFVGADELPPTHRDIAVLPALVIPGMSFPRKESLTKVIQSRAELASVSNKLIHTPLPHAEV